MHPDRQLMLKRASMREHPLVKGGQNSEWLGANAKVPMVGWKAVVQEPAAEALAPLRALVRVALLWICIGLLAAIVLGFTSVRTVTRPVGLNDAEKSFLPPAPARAKEISMLGRRHTPAAFERWGIINLVVAEAELSAASMTMATLSASWALPGSGKIFCESSWPLAGDRG